LLHLLGDQVRHLLPELLNFAFFTCGHRRCRGLPLFVCLAVLLIEVANLVIRTIAGHAAS
jgi:hypothetical protein